MFKATQFASGRKQEKVLAASQTCSRGDGLKWGTAGTAGQLIRCVTDDESVAYTIDYDIATGAGETATIEVTEARKSGIRYEVDLAADSAQAQCGALRPVSAAGVVDNASVSTSTEGFRMDTIVGPAANRKALGYFE